MHGQGVQSTCKQGFTAAERECLKKRAKIHREGELWDAPSAEARVRESYAKRVQRVCDLYMEYVEREEAYFTMPSLWQMHARLPSQKASRGRAREREAAECMCGLPEHDINKAGDVG